MKIWHYHRQTGEFTGEGVADPDPMARGKWLMPAFSTAIKPPVTRERQVAVFAEGGWTVKPDWRGAGLYAPGVHVGRHNTRLDSIGQSPVDFGYTGEDPPKAGPRQVAFLEQGVWRLIPDWRGVDLYGPGEAALGRVARIDAPGVTPAEAGLSDEEPPATGEREAAILEGGAWRIVPDWRGVPLWRKATKTPMSVSQVGELPDFEELTELEPPESPAVFEGGAWAPDLVTIRAQKWEAIKAERDRRTQQGGFRQGNHWFHSDTFSRTQIMGLIQMGSSYFPPGLKWKTMSGAFVDMSYDLARLVFFAAAQSDIAIFAAAEMHRAAVEASADPLAYDFSGGWPPAFGE